MVDPSPNPIVPQWTWLPSCATWNARATVESYTGSGWLEDTANPGWSEHNRFSADGPSKPGSWETCLVGVATIPLIGEHLARSGFAEAIYSGGYVTAAIGALR